MLVSLCARPRAAIFLCRILTLSLLIMAPAVFAGGPMYVAGVTYFNPGVLGQPIHWAGGQLNYYVDQGPLSSTVTNQQATAMVDAAAALWSAVPTACVTQSLILITLASSGSTSSLNISIEQYS